MYFSILDGVMFGYNTLLEQFKGELPHCGKYIKIVTTEFSYDVIYTTNCIDTILNTV